MTNMRKKILLEEKKKMCGRVRKREMVDACSCYRTVSSAFLGSLISLSLLCLFSISTSFFLSNFDSVLASLFGSMLDIFNATLFKVAAAGAAVLKVVLESVSPSFVSRVVASSAGNLELGGLVARVLLELVARVGLELVARVVVLVEG